MTNEEAIEVLDAMKVKVEIPKAAVTQYKRNVSLDMAIEALSKTKQGLSEDDVISRQAAIDILDAYQVMVENGEENPYAWARLRMNELPSAQPELIEKAAYIRGFEQGRTQGMIDTQGGKK